MPTLPWFFPGFGPPPGTPPDVDPPLGTVVSFPYMQETFQRAMQDVLGAFFNTGGILPIGQQFIDFIPCEIVYDKRRLEESKNLTKPLIAILGTRMSPMKKRKCQDPFGEKMFGYEVYTEVYRTIYVKSARNTANPNVGNKREVDRVWGQLLCVISTLQEQFSERNICQPQLSPIPSEVSVPSHAMVMGQFQAKLQAAYSTDPTYP